MNNTSLILVGMVGEEALSQRQAVVDILCQMDLMSRNAPYQNIESGGLRDALAQQPGDCRITMIVGGVGATSNDRTIREVSDLLGISMEYDLETGTRLSRFQPPENSHLIYDCAWLPQGAIVMENEIGPAPGCIIEREGGIIILLPGIPGELAAMLQNRVKPYIDNIFNGEMVSRSFMTFGLSRESLDDRLQKFQGKINPSVKIEDCDPLHHITVSATARNRDMAGIMVDQTMAQMFQLLGNAAFGADCDSFEEVLVNLMDHKKLHVATAESCTAGLLSARLVNVPGASKVFNLGVTAYAADKKVNVLQVPVNIIRVYGEVSAETAVSMASGVQQLGYADIGIGITGIAGPEGGSSEKPVGLVYIAIADKQNVVIRRLKLGRDKSRDYIRNMATLNAMDLLRKYLVSYPVPLKDATPLKDVADNIRKAMQPPAGGNPPSPYMNVPTPLTPPARQDSIFMSAPPQGNAPLGNAQVMPNAPGNLPPQYPVPVQTPPQVTPPIPAAPPAPSGYPMAPPQQNQKLAVERIVNERRK